MLGASGSLHDMCKSGDCLSQSFDSQRQDSEVGRAQFYASGTNQMNSLLETRIQRLEALATQGRAVSHPDDTISQLRQPLPPQLPIPFIVQPETHHTLRIQTENLTDYPLTGIDGANHYPTHSNFGWEQFGAPKSPACYSDTGPELGPWSTGGFQQSIPDNAMLAGALTHKRSHTFPLLSHEESDWTPNEGPPTSAGAFSDIPSIEVISPDPSPPRSPSLALPEQPITSYGFPLPFMPSSLDRNEGEIGEHNPEIPRSRRHFVMNARQQDEQINYYGDLLSPVDQPPTLSRSISVALQANDTSGSDPFPSFGTRLHRSQTLPSILAQQHTIDHDQLNTTLNSPRTQNYLQVFIQQVHPQYPFLSPGTFPARTSANLIATYQTLLAAAIGALNHHKSRSLSSPYVRLATSLAPQVDFWASVSGVHCALLLAMYCFDEETMSFSDELTDQDDQQYQQKLHIKQPLYPRLNLWLHNCQIMATCIDLGLNLGFLSGTNPIGLSSNQEDADLDILPTLDLEIEMEAMYKSTFRAAHIFDGRISRLKNRPRAIHSHSLDSRLILEYMLDTSV